MNTRGPHGTLWPGFEEPGIKGYFSLLSLYKIKRCFKNQTDWSLENYFSSSPVDKFISFLEWLVGC